MTSEASPARPSSRAHIDLALGGRPTQTDQVRSDIETGLGGGQGDSLVHVGTKHEVELARESALREGLGPLSPFDLQTVKDLTDQPPESSQSPHVIRRLPRQRWELSGHSNELLVLGPTGPPDRGYADVGSNHL